MDNAFTTFSNMLFSCLGSPFVPCMKEEDICKNNIDDTSASALLAEQIQLEIVIESGDSLQVKKPENKVDEQFKIYIESLSYEDQLALATDLSIKTESLHHNILNMEKDEAISDA